MWVRENNEFCDASACAGQVRSEKTAKKAMKAAPSATEETFFLADITDKAGLEAALKKEAEGYDALVLLTSAVPKIVYLSLITAFITKILPGELPLADSEFQR